MWTDSYSIVIPLYRSQETISEVVREVKNALADANVCNYEIILVNDCSPDDVFQVACKLTEGDTHIVVVDLAKNVGQERASLAGYSVASGDFIISMDDDLQHPAYEIGNLITAIHERDDDIVFASYISEGGKRPLFRRVGTWLNWKTAEIFAGKPKGIETNSFLIMRSCVKDAIISYYGYDMYTYGIMFKATSHVSNYAVTHRARAVGKSGYTYRRLIRLWISGILSFSLKPLRFIWIMALLTGVAGLIVPAIGSHVPYIATAVLSLIGIGILGEYVGRAYITNECLPKYTIRKLVGSGLADKQAACCMHDRLG